MWGQGEDYLCVGSGGGLFVCGCACLSHARHARMGRTLRQSTKKKKKLINDHKFFISLPPKNNKGAAEGHNGGRFEGVTTSAAVLRVAGPKSCGLCKRPVEACTKTAKAKRSRLWHLGTFISYISRVSGKNTLLGGDYLCKTCVKEHQVEQKKNKFQRAWKPLNTDEALKEHWIEEKGLVKIDR